MAEGESLKNLMLEILLRQTTWDLYEFHSDDFAAWKRHYILGEGCGCPERSAHGKMMAEARVKKERNGRLLFSV